MPEANDVVLVWGVNGWKVVPEEVCLAETFVKNDVMYTLMARSGDIFVAKIQVPLGSIIDYAFRIRQARNGVSVDVWDTNGDPEQDYHTPAMSEVIEIKASAALLDKLRSASGASVDLVTQEIRYYNTGAGEVFLVWGVNGWSTAPEEMRPAGTVVQGSDRYAPMYTPMALTGDVFVAKLNVPAGTTIDYGFKISKKRTGAAVSVWDGNGYEDYHTIATGNGAAEIKSEYDLARAAELPRDFDRGLYLLIGAVIIMGIDISFKRLSRNQGSELKKPANATLKILATGASLCVLLFPIRATVMGFGWISFKTSMPFLLNILFASYHDYLYVVLMTILFLGLLWLFRKNSKAQLLVYTFYIVAALLSLIIALINIKIVQTLGRPFTYQWLYYSDFLKSLDATRAIATNLSWKLLLNVASLGIALLAVSRLLYRGLSFLLPRYSAKVLILPFILLGSLYFPIAHWHINKKYQNFSRLENPIASFLQSILISQSHPFLFTMDLSENFAEFQTVKNDYLNDGSGMYENNAEIRNVIVFIMESVAAEYIEAYGGVYPVNSELKKYLPHSVLFENFYSHVPSTNKSLVSILCSLYPWISYQSLTNEHPDIVAPSLSAELKKQGYRSAFFTSSDNRFQRMDVFLSHRQFDTIEDIRTLQCERRKFMLEDSLDEKESWKFPNAVDDECIVDSFIDWFNQDPQKPHLAVLWTVQTHYPYLMVDAPIDFAGENKLLNRYLNSLYHGDKVLGKLLSWLESKNLLESTLVAVVGDHGEAFGQHQQYGHASNIYEENVHIPLILINPNLFRGERNSTIGGQVDLAPTILSLLKIPAPVEWQGQSLFSSNRRERVYFFTPWSSYLFGYREGNLKFIFDAIRNRHEIYDLSDDPKESTNIAPQMPEVVSAGHKKLAAWVQFQQKFFKGIIPASHVGS